MANVFDGAVGLLTPETDHGMRRVKQAGME